MDEARIRQLVGAVKTGRLSRRSFIQRMVAAGLSAPIASQILMRVGVANAQMPAPYAPTKRGGGGPLRMLYWQGPTLLNPHFATGVKDADASRVFYEPLAGWDDDGNLIPVLAAQLPSREDGSIAVDGMSVTWKLKPGVTWHDGQPLTADDLVFTWEYARDPATSAITIATYRDVTVEKIDALTIKIKFAKPTPFWANAFVGSSVLPKHHFAAYTGDKSRDAPANLKPVGTGPYKIVEFKPGDLLRAEINTAYHIPNMPHFDTLEIKGGGDAPSAARAVLQTGEFDFGWNMLVEDEILLKLEQGGKGRIIFTSAGSIEHVGVNATDPNTEVDGERSSLKTKHPAFQDTAVRQALRLLVDRDGIEKFIFGRTGRATPNFVNKPERFRSKTTTYEFNIDKANAILDAAGWARGPDGIRAKGATKLKWVFQTSINGPRQKAQAIIKQSCQKAGIDIELKAVVAAVYFSTDVANPDTLAKFNADIQMYAITMGQPDSEAFLRLFKSDQMPTKANKWQGRNTNRYVNPEFDAAHTAAESELDPVKRAALLIKCNDLVVEDICVIPIVYRPGVHAVATKLKTSVSGWDSTLAGLNNWYREA